MSKIAPFPGAANIDIDRKTESETLTTKLSYAIQLWAFKILIRASIITTQYITGLESDDKPTYTKFYPSSPGIKAHVYIPKSYRAGDTPLPLLIDIHGGGFAFGAPLFDARDNAGFAHKHGFAIVSIGYRLAPSYPFPAAVHDVADQIRDIFNDKDLPVDWSRVAVIGYSAGGNLALTATQLHGLHERVRASVAYYPPIDFVVTGDERAKWRTPHPDGRADILYKSSYFFTWGYIPVGTQLRNPLLSPRFADKAKLPRSIYILGAEYDMLCHDAWTMAEELAEGNQLPMVEDTRGGDESWECGTVRWKRVMGVEHGFNLMIDHKRGEEAKMYKRKTDEAQADVADWLHRVAFTG